MASSRRVRPSDHHDVLADATRLRRLAETRLLDASAAARLPTLDRVARLAARAARAPVAQVNLVTADAQVPAAAFVDPACAGPDGRPLDAGAADLGGAWRTAVALDASYCQHVVRGGGPVVVDDTSRDARVCDSRATRESGIGAYAAMPVVTPTGEILGTVCVVEFRPRVWSAADLAAIEECAALAGEEVAARLGAARALRESEERLGAALEVARATSERAEAAQAEAEAAHALMAESLDAITDPFYVLDADLRVRVANRRAAEWFALPRDVLLGARLPDLFPQLVRTPAHDLIDRCFAERAPVSAEVRSTIHGRWVRLHAYPSPVGVAVYAEDIDDERRAVAEQARLLVAEREARALAESANRAKSEFLAVMSHELRTPLNAIAGYAELMELGIHGAVTDAQLQALDRIQKSQRHLLGLINGVLNYVRIDAGQVHYRLEDVPVDELLSTCEALVAPQARARRVRLAYGGCAPAVRARADAEKAQQIVLNLLTNAVKFTESGGKVALDCDATPTAVAVRVSDTGIGIPPDKLEAIFEPFVQVDARLTRTREGVGLGLAISRDLARGMGGDLAVESTLGAGSTFTLTLPAARD